MRVLYSVGLPNVSAHREAEFDKGHKPVRPAPRDEVQKTFTKVFGVILNPL